MPPKTKACPSCKKARCRCPKYTKDSESSGLPPPPKELNPEVGPFIPKQTRTRASVSLDTASVSSTASTREDFQRMHKTECTKYNNTICVLGARCQYRHRWEQHGAVQLAKMLDYVIGQLSLLTQEVNALHGTMYPEQAEYYRSRSRSASRQAQRRHETERAVKPAASQRAKFTAGEEK